MRTYSLAARAERSTACSQRVSFGAAPPIRITFCGNEAQAVSGTCTQAMRVSASVNSEAMQGALLCLRSPNLSGLPSWRSATSGAFLRSAGSQAVWRSTDSGVAGYCRRLSWMALCKLASSSDSRRAICKNAASSAEELGATAKLGSLKLAWTSCSSSHHCDSSMASSDAPRPSTCQLNSRFRYAKRGLSLFLLFVFLALLELS
mmetsp:Transcript_55647/g.119770  ORF Transcript_55647/g.119770 Transcript_55647/m.119770 type:complete len:204 (-) Transcript_55647:246-857(-)